MSATAYMDIRLSPMTFSWMDVKPDSVTEGCTNRTSQHSLHPGVFIGCVHIGLGSDNCSFNDTPAQK